MIINYLAKKGTLMRVIDDNQKRINNSSFNLNIAIIESDYEKHDRNLFVVLPTLFEATKYYDYLTEKYSEDELLFYPVDETFISSLAITSPEFKFERINTIINLLNNQKHIIITNINGILKGNLSKEKWQNQIRFYEVNKDYNIQEIKEELVDFGYQNVSVTREVGEFSFRGSIIDFYPISSKSPFRLDFFDTNLESIRLFDVNSQRTTNKIGIAPLVPYQEFFYTEDEKQQLIKYLKTCETSLTEREIINTHIENIDLRKNLEQLTFYGSYFSELSSILDFTNNKKIYLINEEKCDFVIEELKRKNNNYYQEIGSKTLEKFPLFINKEKVLKCDNILYIDPLDKNEKYNFKSIDIPPFNGSKELITREFGKMIHHNYVIVSLQDNLQIGRLKQYLMDELIPYKTINNIDEADINVVNFTEETIPSMYIPTDSLYVVDSNTLFPSKKLKKKPRYKSTFNEGTSIFDYSELQKGDYIVHINHGIGYYEGIKTIELKNHKRDYLSILYADNERLYIPIEQLSMIKKYISAYGRIPKLTKLGSHSWNKTKENVMKKVHELSEQLIKLYSEREKALGHAFKEDCEEQKQFEKDFIYEETKDQLKAIEAVKKDMESQKPMDRLVCGDVGYGKTEVALRAAFKAAMDGMQVCVLAPTTILARQHYFTFKERMEKYGVRVELLNRFVSTKDANKILHDLEFGSVDILIGTHRVLSDDVKFKKLGLLITDEEQRFGVKHKEKIKTMRVNVDSLMLSATPIPRTLQMSLVGIKELSLIETPPKNRYPVQTYVTEQNDALIKEAIEREIVRGGQVFYLYNYTEDIEDKASEIAHLVKEAKVVFAHGKMDKKKLEQTVQDFIDKKYDVLVSTTIIENGIDIPEANTLIVEDADRLGLSQMYQIRGRVGRSDKIAYAYFMYEPRKILSSDSEKRLNTILEYQELGSGFKVAMRDLAIRGSGDILGAEQSGFIDSVGLDTYMDILDKELKRNNPQNENKPMVKNNFKYTQVLSNRFIPEEYQLDESLKIEIHEKINQLKTLSDVDDLMSEFTDRFGKVNKELEIYMYEKLFIYLCGNMGVENVDIKSNLLTLTLSEEISQNIDGEKIFREAYSLSDDFTLQYKNYKITIYLKLNRFKDASWLLLVCRLLSQL